MPTSIKSSRALLPPRFGYATIPHRVARFRQVNTHRPNVHHDALEFPDGKVVLVTTLRGGQTATVLQLPADPDFELWRVAAREQIPCCRDRQRE